MAKTGTNKLKLGSTLQSSMSEMSEGNPGAINVLCSISINTGRIDPQQIMGCFGPILFMDTLEIYGSRIWMLYTYVCKSSIVMTLAVLRAVQLGLLDELELDISIDDGQEIDLLKVLKDVQGQLDQFAKDDFSKKDLKKFSPVKDSEEV